MRPRGSDQHEGFSPRVLSTHPGRPEPAVGLGFLSRCPYALSTHVAPVALPVGACFLVHTGGSLTTHWLLREGVSKAPAIATR